MELEDDIVLSAEESSPAFSVVRGRRPKPISRPPVSFFKTSVLVTREEASIKVVAAFLREVRELRLCPELTVDRCFARSRNLS